MGLFSLKSTRASFGRTISIYCRGSFVPFDAFSLSLSVEFPGNFLSVGFPRATREVPANENLANGNLHSGASLHAQLKHREDP